MRVAILTVSDSVATGARTVDTSGDAIAAWSRISAAKVGASLAIGVERRGAPVTLTFRLRP